MNERELERYVDAEIRRLEDRMRRHVDRLVSDLHDDVHEELAALDRRLTETHRAALKVLTDHYSRR